MKYEIKRDKFYGWFVKLISNGWQWISFQKKDGSIERRKASLDSKLVDFEEVKGGKKVNPNVCPYYDLEKDGWRCFCLENVISVGEYDVVLVD